MTQTVMIADDSIPLHRLIRAQLGADNLDFVSVYDGTTAVSTAASMHPDLILMDIDMPMMDGFEACRRIKTEPATASIPVLFLSADSMSSDKKKAFALGAFDYLQKPFKPQQLKATVHSRLHALIHSEGAASTDPLTGLWNKASFEMQLGERFVLAQLASQSISCVVTEIDQLGTINVRFGNRMASRIIQKVARILSNRPDAEPTVCRLPNSRFASLYTNTDRFTASRLTEEIRSEIATTIASDCGVGLEVTCSFGVCDSQIASAAMIFDRATSVLHRALDRGGNCVAVARSESKF